MHSNEIREAGRSTQGVRLLRLEDEDKIAAAAAILEEEVNGANGTGGAAPNTPNAKYGDAKDGAKEGEPEKS